MSNRTEQISAVEEKIRNSGLFDFAWQYVDLTDDKEKEVMLNIAVTETATAIADTEIKKAELRGRMAAYQDFFEWECDDCNPEGFAKQRISELEAELKGLGE